MNTIANFRKLNQIKHTALWSDLRFLRMERDAFFRSLVNDYDDISEDLEDMCRGFGGYGFLRNRIAIRTYSCFAVESLDLMKEVVDRISELERKLITEPILIIEFA